MNIEAPALVDYQMEPSVMGIRVNMTTRKSRKLNSKIYALYSILRKCYSRGYIKADKFGNMFALWKFFVYVCFSSIVKTSEEL